MSGEARETVPPLGLVLGRVPATPLKFNVSLRPSQYAQLDDVVVTNRELPGSGSVQIAGVVTNVRPFMKVPVLPRTCS